MEITFFFFFELGEYFSSFVIFFLLFNSLTRSNIHLLASLVVNIFARSLPFSSYSNTYSSNDYVKDQRHQNHDKFYDDDNNPKLLDHLKHQNISHLRLIDILLLSYRLTLPHPM